MNHHSFEKELKRLHRLAVGTPFEGSFPLRADFAGEIGFEDILRTPMSREAHADATAGAPAPARDYEAYLQALATLPIRRFLAYLLYRPPGEAEARAVASNGVDYEYVEKEGLFTDLINRVRAHVRLPEGARLPIEPEEMTPPDRQEGAPRYFVLHDSLLGRAIVLPAERFCSALGVIRLDTSCFSEG